MVYLTDVEPEPGVTDWKEEVLLAAGERRPGTICLALDTFAAPNSAPLGQWERPERSGRHPWRPGCSGSDPLALQ